MYEVDIDDIGPALLRHREDPVKTTRGGTSDGGRWHRRGLRWGDP